MDSSLRLRILASISRALWGEVFPAIRRVEFTLSADGRDLSIWVAYDGEVAEEDLDDLRSAFAEVTADFAWPERGDPAVTEQFERVDAPTPLQHRGEIVYLRRERPVAGG
jgi:hypothetical protein